MALERSDNAALFWNGVLLDAAKADSRKPPAEQEQAGPTRVSRAAAIVHAVVHNAVNGVNHRNAFYRDPATGQPGPPEDPPDGARQEAAGAGAAHRALVALYPSQEATFDQARAAFQALPIKGANHGASFGFGAGVAQQLLEARADDGSSSADKYNPPTQAPGVWEPDPELAPPGPPLTPRWGSVRLFLLDAISRVSTPPFVALSSGDYAFAFENVREVGSADSETRTEDQTNIALFFSYDDRLGSTVRLYNQHAFQILRQEPDVPQGVSVLHRRARLFALINLAMADAGIACWDAKFDPPGFRPPGSTRDPGFHIWRPFQGIRRADEDGNDATDPDKEWLPLGRPRARDANGNPVEHTTPNFPAYVSGHSSFGAANYGMLRKFFGEKPFEFRLSSEEVDNTRRYSDRTETQTGLRITSWDKVIDENGASRIFLGVHWRADDIRGKPLGQQVADYIWEEDFLDPTT